VVLAAVGLPLVLLAEPFVPLSSGVFVLALVVGALAHKVWRSVTHLRERPRAGVALLAEALARQCRVVDVEGTAPTAAAMSLVCITSESAAVGQPLAFLRLPPRSGAHILTIQRPGVGGVLPALTERLVPGDVVTLLGTDESIERARVILLAGPAVEATLLATHTPPSEGSPF
jgi:K+/H+ antiporter YhaU regulatory subunit KhtT